METLKEWLARSRRSDEVYIIKHLQHKFPQLKESSDDEVLSLVVDELGVLPW